MENPVISGCKKHPKYQAKRRPTADCATCRGIWTLKKAMEQGPVFFAEGSKPTNPKDAIGSNKLPLHLWPETATVYGALGLLDGMLKYGRSNFRAIGVRTSIYADALKRHANLYFEGEDIDPDSGLPHLCHALASIAIIIDAEAAGKLTDDRQYPGGYRKILDEMTPHVRRLKEKYAKTAAPHHYTIADKVKEAGDGIQDQRGNARRDHRRVSRAKVQ